MNENKVLFLAFFFKYSTFKTFTFKELLHQQNQMNYQA